MYQAEIGINFRLSAIKYALARRIHLRTTSLKQGAMGKSDSDARVRECFWLAQDEGTEGAGGLEKKHHARQQHRRAKT